MATARWTMEMYWQGYPMPPPRAVSFDEMRYIARGLVLGNPQLDQLDLINGAARMAIRACIGEEWEYPFVHYLYLMKSPFGFRFSKSEQIAQLVQCHRATPYLDYGVDRDFIILMCMVSKWSRDYSFAPTWQPIKVFQQVQRLTECVVAQLPHVKRNQEVEEAADRVVFMVSIGEMTRADSMIFLDHLYKSYVSHRRVQWYDGGMVSWR